MNAYKDFEVVVENAASIFRSWDVKGPVRIISHLDADGITACSLISKLLSLENITFSISIIQQLDSKTIEDLSSESYNTFIFTDLGSGSLDEIKKYLVNKKVLILDHHEINGSEGDNMLHVNPHLVGIDGNKEISGSGVVYFFAKALNKDIQRYAHLAIVGCVGDVQEDNGFLHLNSQILKDAVDNNLIEVEQGLRLFGLRSKPLHRVLAYCKEIPGVIDESTSVQFLLENNISPKSENRWRKLSDLSSSEKQRLIASIIMKRCSKENPEDVIGNVYSLPKEEVNELKDVKEFSTVLNACGRMDRVSFGIGSCLGDERCKRKALSTLVEYRSEIVKALNWFKDNKKSENIISKPGFIIINAKGFVKDTVIGTLASILSKSNDIESGTFIMSLARKINDKTKVSLRYCGDNEDINLRNIVDDLTNIVGGEAGGHAAAAGAIIPSEIEDSFIKAAVNSFSKLSLEEKVL